MQTFHEQKLKDPGVRSNLHSRSNPVLGHPWVSSMGIAVFVLVFGAG